MTSPAVPGEGDQPAPFASLTIEDFCRQLGSAQPAPGGGAAAALLAKLAASLVQMVVRHTLGRPRYAAVQERMQAILDEAEALGRQAGDLMDADARAYGQVAAAFKLDREDPARARAVGQACRQATEVPLQVMRLSARLAEVAVEVYRHGNQTLSGDARAGLLAAQAAADISAGNVRANGPFIADAAWADQAMAEAQRLLDAIGALCASL